MTTRPGWGVGRPVVVGAIGCDISLTTARARRSPMRAVSSLLLLVAPLLALGPVSSGGPGTSTVTVSGGLHDRRDTVVSFRLPDASARGPCRLRDAAGTEAPLQVDAAGRAWFVVPELAAGATRTYRLARGAAHRATHVVAAREGDDVRIAWEGRPVIRYQGGAGVLPADDVKPVFRRGGYFHPIHTPSGRIVSDDYPPDHRHHHGVWFAWTKTGFEGRAPDFWNMGDEKGRVELESLDASWSGAVHAGLRARHRYVDLTGRRPATVLRETWEARAYAVGLRPRPFFVFDLDVTQTNVASSALALPEYHYGGLGFRGARGWRGETGAAFLTSEGKDRTNGHATRARWCHVSGPVDGRMAGMAILGHPDNFRAPEPMRIHPNEPFFCFAPSQLGRWEIAPAATHRARYRFVVQDGPPDARELDRVWNDYAAPPGVTVQ